MNVFSRNDATRNAGLSLGLALMMGMSGTSARAAHADPVSAGSGKASLCQELRAGSAWSSVCAGVEELAARPEAAKAGTAQADVRPVVYLATVQFENDPPVTFELSPAAGLPAHARTGTETSFVKGCVESSATSTVLLTPGAVFGGTAVEASTDVGDGTTTLTITQNKVRAMPVTNNGRCVVQLPEVTTAKSIVRVPAMAPGSMVRLVPDGAFQVTVRRATETTPGNAPSFRDRMETEEGE